MSTIETRQVDVHDDNAMHEAYVAFDRGLMHGREGAPVWHEHEYVAMFRSPDEGEDQEVHVALEEGVVAGTMNVFVPVRDNLDKVYADLAVDPAHRCRGAGSALIALLERRATELGRDLLLLDSRMPFGEVEDHRHRRFADQHGFLLSNVEVVRHQDLPVSGTDLDTWAALAAEKTTGYEISTHINDFPAELTDSLCSLLGQLAVDAPSGMVDFEEEVMTPARLEQRQELNRAMGRESFETVAVKEGVVAAQTTLSVPVTGADAFQWGTFVHRGHRGHRLGLAVKVANLRAVQAAHPHVTRIRTQNAETNQWMIAINELMRMEPFEVCADFVKRL